MIFPRFYISLGLLELLSQLNCARQTSSDSATVLCKCLGDPKAQAPAWKPGLNMQNETVTRQVADLSRTLQSLYNNLSSILFLQLGLLSGTCTVARMLGRPFP